MKVVFFEGGGFAAKAIQLATFSRWNHVGIYAGGYYYESKFFGGVTCIRNPVFKSDTVTLEVPCSNEEEELVKQFLQAQVGKKYDWTAIIALPFRKSWQDEDSWFCSELVSASLSHAKVTKFPYKSHRITPRDLYFTLSTLYR